MCVQKQSARRLKQTPSTCGQISAMSMYYSTSYVHIPTLTLSPYMIECMHNNLFKSCTVSMYNTYVCMYECMYACRYYRASSIKSPLFWSSSLYSMTIVKRPLGMTCTPPQLFGPVLQCREARRGTPWSRQPGVGPLAVPHGTPGQSRS